MKRYAVLILLFLCFPFEFFCLEMELAELFSSVDGLSSSLDMNGNPVSIISGTSRSDPELKCNFLLSEKKDKINVLCLEEEFDLASGEIVSVQSIVCCGLNFYFLNTQCGYFYLLFYNTGRNLILRKIHVEENGQADNFKAAIGRDGRMLCSYVAGGKLVLFELNGRLEVNELDSFIFDFHGKTYFLQEHNGIIYLIHESKEKFVVRTLMENWWNEIYAEKKKADERLCSNMDGGYFAMGNRLYGLENYGCREIFKFKEYGNIVSMEHSKNCGEDFITCLIEKDDCLDLVMTDRNEIVKTVGKVGSYLSADDGSSLYFGLDGNDFNGILSVSGSNGSISELPFEGHGKIIGFVYYNKRIFYVRYDGQDKFLLNHLDHEVLNPTMEIKLSENAFDEPSSGSMYLKGTNLIYFIDPEKSQIRKYGFTLCSPTEFINGKSYVTFIKDLHLYAFEAGEKNEK